jgi:hypothetical protein
MKAIGFNDNYPKVEYPGSDFITDTSIIHDFIFAIQQVTIMQEWLTWLLAADIIFLATLKIAPL